MHQLLHLRVALSVTTLLLNRSSALCRAEGKSHHVPLDCLFCEGMVMRVELALLLLVSSC